MYRNIPNEMRSLPNWVCWQASPDPKSHSGIQKTPINPKTGGQAMSNNPDTWSDFDTAVRASANFSGIGFMFSNSPYFGVDIDDLPEDIEDFKNGGSDNIISEFVNSLQSYAEYSQSGNGIHIICRGTLPKGRRKKKPLEMYENGRFFIMTGNCCSEYADINDCTESIKPLHLKYLGHQKTASQKPSVSLSSHPNDIIEKAINSKNGNLFNALLHGDTSAYSSPSEADMAFCNMLAFWTDCNAEMMDSIFRSSGLMRDKWDRKQSGTTYGAITIDKAIRDCETVYEPKQSKGYSFTIGKNRSKTKTYSMDDMGNAQRFFDVYGGDVRYCYPEKRWLYWDKKRWKTDSTGTLERMADTVVDSMETEIKAYQAYDEQNGTDTEKAFQKHIKKSRSNSSRKSMITELQHYVPILPAQMDKYKDRLNTPQGVLDLKNGTLSPHNKKLYLTKITAVELSENGCPQWERFLDDIFAGDKDLIRYVQKAVGYSLTGSTAEQCAFFLFGTGRNGKSTFIDIIAELFGDYTANIQPETIMIKTGQSNGANSDIARLKGARLVTSVEPNEGVRLNEGLLKQLTGGDTVTARKLYSEEFEFKPEFKLWISTNHKPIIRGTDTGIWRRIILIPFNVAIPAEKVDKELKQKLRAELPAIFKWCIDGCKMYLNEGLKPVKAVADCVKEYKREMDVISVFIDDMCIEEGTVQSSLLYSAYSDWARRNNEYEMSATKFGIEIAKRYKKVTGKKYNFFQGISLR